MHCLRNLPACLVLVCAVGFVQMGSLFAQPSAKVKPTYRPGPPIKTPPPGPGRTAPVSTRLIIPDAAALKAAAKDIKDLYGDQFKQAKSVKAKTALARELFKQGVGTRDDPASRYELLRIAKNIATGAGDTDLALQAIGQLDRFYKVDALQLKTDALQSITKTFESKEQNKAVAEKASSLINPAVAADRFDLAKQLAEIALAAARKVRDRDLTKQLADRLEELKPLEAEYAKVKLAFSKLETEPTDSTANLTVGKFRCFVQGNWSAGLPMIALGSDAKLQKLAVAELKNPSTHTAQASLANGWWTLSETLEGSAKLKLRQHAALWYRRALPRLTGIAKVKATRRLGELAPKTSIAKKTGSSSKNLTAKEAAAKRAAAIRAAAKQAAAKYPAGAVQFQGHWYKVYPGKTTWRGAAALSKRLGGHLVCIETRAEAQFVARLARGNRLWLGGGRNSRGQWTWVNGKPMTLIIWASGQPDNVGGIENYLELGPTGAWNDVPVNAPWPVGYICEWEK